MKLPVKYCLRSVTQRPMRSILTLAGIGLSVFLSVMMLGLSRGLVASTVATGEPLNVLVLSKGAESIEFSALDPGALHILSSISGLKNYQGRNMACPEVTINSLVSTAGMDADPFPVLVRGVREELGWVVHPQVSLVAGKEPRRGFEVAVGPLVATRLGVSQEKLAIGRTIEFEGQNWEIVGHLSAPGTAFEAEIWTQVDDLLVASRRDDYSSLVLAAVDTQSVDEILFDLKTRTDVRSEVHVESEYYAAGTQQMKPVQAVALLMTILLISGGLMSGMNTMFNSVMGRTREMAVLHVLGYRRRAVLAGFVLESILLCLAGGLLGCLCGLLLNGLPMRFSMGAFRFMIDAVTISTGIGLSLAIGIFGAAVPVMRVARLKTVEGLRLQT